MWVVVVVVAVAVVGASVIAMVLLRRRYVVVAVDGPSMEPSYVAGDRVVVRRMRGERVHVGDVVVVQRPRIEQHGWVWAPAPNGGPIADQAWQIKRLVARPGDPVPPPVAEVVGAGPGDVVPAGRLVVFGDNAGVSSDSRDFGYVPIVAVLGQVRRRLSDPA